MRLLRSIVFTLLFTVGTHAHAGFLDEAWGILTDPLKIDKGTGNIAAAAERTMIHLERIQKQLGADANAIVDRVDKTLGETRKDIFRMITLGGSEAKAVTDNAITKLSGLQADLFKNAENFVRCSTEVSLKKMQSTLSQTLNDLGERKPRIEIWGYVVVEAKLDPQDIEPHRVCRRPFGLSYAAMAGSSSMA